MLVKTIITAALVLGIVATTACSNDAAAPPVVASVTLSAPPASLSVGATNQFTATAADASGNAMTGVRVFWMSSDPGIATVDSTGLARGVHSGMTTIAAIAGGYPGYATLTVNATDDRIIVTSFTVDSVTVFNAVTMAKIQAFPVTDPFSVAVGPDHRYYAGTSGTIRAISPATGYQATLGGGTLSGNIYGTTVSRDGVIFATGSSMTDIRLLNLDGVSLGNILSPSGTNLRVTALGADGSLYLTSFGAGPVQRYLPGGVSPTAFGGGGLATPFGVVVRASGQVVVVSQDQNVFYTFTGAGVYVGQTPIGCTGQTPNAAVDSSDNLWITCVADNKVVKFDSQNHAVGQYTVTAPYGIAFEAAQP